jgi:hypothetical protein
MQVVPAESILLLPNWTLHTVGEERLGDLPLARSAAGAGASMTSFSVSLV